MTLVFKNRFTSFLYRKDKIQYHAYNLEERLSANYNILAAHFK